MAARLGVEVPPGAGNECAAGGGAEKHESVQCALLSDLLSLALLLHAAAPARRPAAHSPPPPTRHYHQAVGAPADMMVCV